jgi:hypothetical protein
MATTQLTRPNSEAAIFARLWEGKAGSLTVPLARHVLKLGFDENDTARMHELAERNRRGQLTAAERDELDNFVRVGDLLAILQSKARKLLKRAPSARNGHG